MPEEVLQGAFDFQLASGIFVGEAGWSSLVRPGESLTMVPRDAEWSASSWSASIGSEGLAAMPESVSLPTVRSSDKPVIGHYVEMASRTQVKSDHGRPPVMAEGTLADDLQDESDLDLAFSREDYNTEEAEVGLDALLSRWTNVADFVRRSVDTGSTSSPSSSGSEWSSDSSVVS